MPLVVAVRSDIRRFGTLISGKPFILSLGCRVSSHEDWRNSISSRDHQHGSWQDPAPVVCAHWWRGHRNSVLSWITMKAVSCWLWRWHLIWNGWWKRSAVIFYYQILWSRQEISDQQLNFHIRHRPLDQYTKEETQIGKDTTYVSDRMWIFPPTRICDNTDFTENSHFPLKREKKSSATKTWNSCTCLTLSQQKPTTRLPGNNSNTAARFATIA